MAKEETYEKEDTAFIHGGGPKVGRIHFSIEAYKRSKRSRDWEEMYQAIDDLFLECEAYFTPPEREELFPLMKQINSYIEVIRAGGREPRLYGEGRVVVTKLWHVLRRLELDMAPKEKRRWLTGAV